MPLVAAKCTQCGGVLEVDSTHDAAICKYCGTPFITEKAINNYNVTNNIQASVVNIYGGNSADFQITAGKLVKYNGASTDVVIPNSVTHIGGSAFRNCSGLTGVTIPNGVTHIEGEAFYGCSGLTSMTIPNSVTHIGNWAFKGCTGLIKVTVPNNNIDIAYDAFLDSPYGRRMEEERRAKFLSEEAQREKWRQHGRCTNCGGKFSFSGKCKSCGAAKSRN